MAGNARRLEISEQMKLKCNMNSRGLQNLTSCINVK